ncbi:SAM-dependent methyltransferase [Streptomyces avermitilis]
MTSPLSGSGSGAQPLKIDTSKPHPARMYDYFLGGKDDYEVDRETAEQFIKVAPEVRAGVRANRRFMHRAVRHVVAEGGVRQILDVGTGLPTEPNVHQIAHAIAPETRVVYVDNDPIVSAHPDVRKAIDSAVNAVSRPVSWLARSRERGRHAPSNVERPRALGCRLHPQHRGAGEHRLTAGVSQQPHGEHRAHPSRFRMQRRSPGRSAGSGPGGRRRSGLRSGRRRCGRRAAS